MHKCVVCATFFFFQAEDGIRDKLVTGVQTCALPIFRLEKMGYVRRQRSKKDRRKILIQRTSKDKNLESEYVRLSQEHAKIFYHGFTEEQIERFEMDLKQILNNLMDYESNAD